MSDQIKKGYWSIAAQKHLKEFKTTSSQINNFDSLNTAGKSGRLLGVIRGNNKLDNMSKIEVMANSIGITRFELNRIILPELERASDQAIELKKNAVGEIIGLEEYVFTNNSVLNITGQLFENLDPTSIERISIETMDETKKIPYMQNELTQQLVSQAFLEEDVVLALALQHQYKLIQIINRTKTVDPIISNEYVWGPNHEKIAMALASIDLGRKQNLKQVIETIQAYQGTPVEKLPPIDEDLLLLAKKSGMINPTTIVSSRGFQKDFGFSANLQQESTYEDDIFDDVKLLLASIRFGENYTPYSTISDPQKFLSSLIRDGEVGPHAANSTDYILLEKKGIVKVERGKKYNSYYGNWREGYMLKLVKEDVARKALELISGTKNYLSSTDSEDIDFTYVSDTGRFITAEETRVSLGETPEYIQEAEEHLNKLLRNELL